MADIDEVPEVFSSLSRSFSTSLSKESSLIGRKSLDKFDIPDSFETSKSSLSHPTDIFIRGTSGDVFKIRPGVFVVGD